MSDEKPRAYIVRESYKSGDLTMESAAIVKETAKQVLIERRSDAFNYGTRFHPDTIDHTPIAAAERWLKWATQARISYEQQSMASKETERKALAFMASIEAEAAKETP